MPVLLRLRVITSDTTLKTNRRSIRERVSHTTLRLDIGGDVYQGSEKMEERPFT